MKREKSESHEMGLRRLNRYSAAFDWLVECMDTGHYLEAVAVLDSLLGDRLASRLSYVAQEEPDSCKSAVGPLCRALEHQQNDPSNERARSAPQFLPVILEIKAWAGDRNVAMHQTAKIFRNGDSPAAFDDVRALHEDTARRGIELLRRFDEIDTEVRAARGRVPGTYPYAFFPELRGGSALAR
ncbi:hypothetical protein ACWDOP_12115 [Nocardia sp. NPDC003693]